MHRITIIEIRALIFPLFIPIGFPQWPDLHFTEQLARRHIEVDDDDETTPTSSAKISDSGALLLFAIIPRLCRPAKRREAHKTCCCCHRRGRWACVWMRQCSFLMEFFLIHSDVWALVIIAELSCVCVCVVLYVFAFCDIFVSLVCLVECVIDRWNFVTWPQCVVFVVDVVYIFVCVCVWWDYEQPRMTKLRWMIFSSSMLVRSHSFVLCVNEMWMCSVAQFLQPLYQCTFRQNLFGQMLAVGWTDTDLRNVMRSDGSNSGLCYGIVFMSFGPTLLSMTQLERCHGYAPHNSSISLEDICIPYHIPTDCVVCN